VMSEESAIGTPGRAGNDTARILDELSRNNSARATTKVRRQRLRVILVLLLLFLLLAGLAYTSWNHWRTSLALISLVQETELLERSHQESETLLLAQIERMNNQIGNMAAQIGDLPGHEQRSVEQIEQIEQIPLLRQELQALQERMVQDIDEVQGSVVRMRDLQ